MFKSIFHVHYTCILSLLALMIGLTFFIGCTSADKDIPISGQDVDEKKADPISINPQ